MKTRQQRAGIKSYHTKIINAISSCDVSDIIELSSDIRAREYNWEYETDNESLICKVITPTTWKSFCRFGDRKRATDLMRMLWIRTDGEPLDTQAMWLNNDAGTRIHPSDFAGFMSDFDGGCNQFPYIKQTESLKSLYKELTKFNWTYKMHEFVLQNFSEFATSLQFVA